MERLFEHNWFFVGTRGDVPKKRDYLKFQVFGEQYFLVHGMDGKIRGYANRCAHQSARLVGDDTGRCAARIICPNHQWAFDMDSGAVVHASFMPDDFVKSCEAEGFALTSINLREVGFMLFACLGDNPDHAALDRMAEIIAPYTDLFALAEHGYKQAHHSREIIDANWLHAMINNRECCHCELNHKRLLNLFYPSAFNGAMTPDYQEVLNRAQARWTEKGLAWEEIAFDPHDYFRIARYPMAEGFKSITFDGELASQKLIGPFAGGEPDSGTLSFWLNPNCWVHFVSDHIAVNWLLPLGTDQTELYTSWIVHADAKDGVDYDLDHLTDVWNVTNAEDVGLCKSMHDGAKSRYYKPGPYSPQEQFCIQFSDWYMRRSEAAA